MKLVTVRKEKETKLKKGDIAFFQINGALTLYRPKKTHVPVSPEYLCFVDNDGVHHEDFHIGSSWSQVNVRIFKLLEAVRGGKIEEDEKREIVYLEKVLSAADTKGAKIDIRYKLFEYIKFITGLKYRVINKTSTEYIRVKFT